MFEINKFEQPFTDQVCQLILNIQQNEFQVPITLADQPDLLNIRAVYQQNGGNFWIATSNSAVIGSLGLIDCGGNIGCIRKMFVRADWRGAGKGVAQGLLFALEKWAMQHDLQGLYLGTIERLQAAIQFYVKNGFEPVNQEDLPSNFPRMDVDTLFFGKKLI